MQNYDARNLVGITIHAQRQLEFAGVEQACDYNYQTEDEERVDDFTQQRWKKPQSDV
jgi:hypothetical protein